MQCHPRLPEIKKDNSMLINMGHMQTIDYLLNIIEPIKTYKYAVKMKSP